MPGGYLVPKGSQVTAVIHSIHVNKEYWSDPLTFRPERWGEAEAKRNQSSKAYIPFATGARSCIGFSLALQETKIILSRVVLNFQVRNETDGQVAYDPDFSLYRPLNLMVTLHDQPDAEETLKEAEVKKDQNEDQVEVKEQSKNVSVGRKDLPTFHIVHASAGGTCEGYASELGSKLKSMGIDSKVTSLMDSPVAQFEGEVTAVIITATYNGSPPDNALDFEEILDVSSKCKAVLRREPFVFVSDFRIPLLAISFVTGSHQERRQRPLQRSQLRCLWLWKQSLGGDLPKVPKESRCQSF